jgi:hypothetical protein
MRITERPMSHSVGKKQPAELQRGPTHQRVG